LIPGIFMTDNKLSTKSGNFRTIVKEQRI